MGQQKTLFSLLVLTMTVLSTSCGGSIPDAFTPDRILVNAKIITVDEDFSIADAVAIRDGKFVAVGSDREIRSLAGPRTEVIDLEGKTVLPGFIDGHVHVTLIGDQKIDPLETRFRNAESIEEVLDILREKMAILGPDEILWFDRGFDRPSAYKENRWPTRFDLDKVSRDRPILLSMGPAGNLVNVYGVTGPHVIVNTKLMRDAGISSRTPQPQTQGLQGEIVKDSRGEPNGVFLGWAALSLVRRNIQLYPTEAQVENILYASERMLKYGITSVGDPNSFVASTNDNIPLIRSYQRLAAEERLPVRVNCILRVPFLTIPLKECVNYLDSIPVEPGFGNDFLMIRRVKLVINSSRGDFKLPHDDVKTVVKAVHRAGWQLMVHVLGGEAFDVALEAIDEAYEEYPDGPQRHLITHAINPSDENLEILVRRGILVDPQPGTLYTYADDAEETFQEPGRKSYGPLPLRTYLDRGVGLMISSDQQPVGPMFHIFEAVKRVRMSGKPIVPEEAITVEEAIRAHTITPAYANFQSDIKGSIEPGKFADLIVLGKDILKVPSMEIKDIPVLRTMVGGDFVYVNPDQDPNQDVGYWDTGRNRFLKLDVPGMEAWR